MKKGRLLSPELTEEIFRPQELYRKYGRVTQFMGFGFQIFLKNDNDEILYIQKDGINYGVSCVMNYYPKNDMTIIMTNHDTNVWDLGWEVQEVILEREGE